MNNKKTCYIILATLIFTFFFADAKAQEVTSAKEAWTNLVGERFSKRPEFAFVENDPLLPNVLLYGDSISIHYTQDVRKVLDTKANVYRLYRNGASSSGLIAFMQKMHSIMGNTALKNHWSFQWDVIHFNVGLHDLKYIKDGKLDKINGKQVSSIADYKANLRNIIVYFKALSPNAKLYFATTTPVPVGAEGRFEGDAEKYNVAALEVLQDYPEIHINDLYQLTKPKHAVWWIKEGDVHYNEIGRAAQGKQVANNIMSGIKLK